MPLFLIHSRSSPGLFYSRSYERDLCLGWGYLQGWAVWQNLGSYVWVASCFNNRCHSGPSLGLSGNLLTRPPIALFMCQLPSRRCRDMNQLPFGRWWWKPLRWRTLLSSNGLCSPAFCPGVARRSLAQTTWLQRRSAHFPKRCECRRHDGKDPFPWNPRHPGVKVPGPQPYGDPAMVLGTLQTYVPLSGSRTLA